MLENKKYILNHIENPEEISQKLFTLVQGYWLAIKDNNNIIFDEKEFGFIHSYSDAKLISSQIYEFISNDINIIDSVNIIDMSYHNGIIASRYCEITIKNENIEEINAIISLATLF